jgi:HPt (histidine-containing phosphotransfer) domain-containing protein
MEKGNNKYIDLSYLKQIANGSNEFIGQMITVFIEEIPIEIRNLETHLGNKDYKALRATAHKMKPSFSFMGVKELEDTVHLIEEYSNEEKNLDQLPDMIKKVKNITNDVIVELDSEKELFL